MLCRAESDRESGPEDDKHRMDDVFASDEEDEPQDRSNRCVFNSQRLFIDVL
jgi:hypothetical protein